MDRRVVMIGFASDYRAVMTGLGFGLPGCNDRLEASCRRYVPLYKAIKSHSLRRAFHLTFAPGYLPA